MSILYGSLWTRKIRFRLTLILFSLNFWLNQIGNIVFDNYKTIIDIKNTTNSNYLNIKNFFTESETWVYVFGNSIAEISNFDPYIILYYVLVVVSTFFWFQIVYATFFAIADYSNEKELNRRKRKKMIYFFILIINIGVYIFLIREIYNPF